MLEPVKRSRIYERIVEQIQTLIANGTFKPGQQLPTERDLARTFQVSRTTVREALRALEMAGVIEGKQGGGTFVRDVSTEMLVRPLASALLKGKRELDDIFEVRQLVEPGVARLAALRRTDDQLQRLEELLERQRAKVAAGENFVDEDTQFHYLLAVAADNPVLLRLQDTIMALVRESRADYLQGPDRAQRSLANHEAILEAVRRGDGDAAQAATRQHIEAVRERIVPSDVRSEWHEAAGRAEPADGPSRLD